MKELLISNPSVRPGKSALRILELVNENEPVTIPEMARDLGITERAIEKNIQKLKDHNLLERKEGERSGYRALVAE